MTEPITTRMPTPEQLDVARDIVQTWSINQIGGAAASSAWTGC